MAKVLIKGAIISNDEQWIYDWLEWDATSPRNVQNQIAAANGEDLIVEINSGGGSVFDASEIYTSLKEYPGNVTTKIVGLAASAASVIAMASNKLMMAPTAQMMIHNAWIRAEGDAKALGHMVEVLKNVNQTVANAYRIKTGKTDAELLQLMNEETWFTPQQALEHGFIDEIMFEEKPLIVAAGFENGMLPVKLIEKLKNIKLNNLICPQDESDFLLEQTTKLNLLKLGGKTDE